MLRENLSSELCSKIVIDYGQEIPQSKMKTNRWHCEEELTQQSQDTRKTNKANLRNQLCRLLSIEMIAKQKWT